MYRRFRIAFLAGLVLVLTSAAAMASEGRVTPEEEFKGRPPAAELTMGAMAGLGVLDSRGGFALIGNIAKKIVHRGFVPDLNNQVFIELQLGPLFIRSATAWFYSTHLRWDFRRDSEWTFFAIGGLAGHISGVELGDRWTVLPRFGVGAFWKVAPLVTLRGELSHELITTGISYSL